LNEKKKGFWVYIAPAIFYGILIIIATGTPGAYLPTVGIPGLDKVVHFGMHFLFAMLVHRALLYYSNGTINKSHTLLLTVLFVSVFGIVIEWYQTLIPGRAPTIGDGVANILGAVVYLILYTIGLSRIWPERSIRVLRNQGKKHVL
jgi:VanZ family protein